MNPKSNPLLPGAGRSRKRFSTWLSWLVISAQILALVTTATVGAIQPTPQVAQEAARSLELPPWLSNSLAGLAWGVQQLLGAPQSAQAALPAPGGVDANLRLWVKASAGTNTTTPGANVTTWADQSGNGANMAVTVAGREPTYQAAAAATNYNPALLFADPNDGMELAPFMTGTEAGGSVFGAAANNTPGTGFDNLVDFGIDNPHLGTAAGTGAPLGYMNGSSPIRNDHPTVPIASQFHLWSWEWTMAAEPSNTLSNTGLDVIFNGEVFSEPTMEVRASSFAEGAPSANEFQIGSYEAVEVWDGPIGEVVVYDRNLTAVESQRVSSYLAIKYGTTLDSDDASTTANYDYLASDGTSIIWPGTSNATYQPYHNNVAGIGRDDNSALDQRKSHSVNAGFQPVLDNGAAFTTDKSFLVWGNDTGAATFAITYAPTSFTPPAGYFRMARVWKVQETGTVGNVAVQATNADHLLVSSDPTFASGVTEIDMSSGSATVNFTNGQYFTFGALLTAPGGVVSGLQAWYDAASGVTLSGSNVSGWDDRTTNGHDTTQATASRQPLFEDGTLGINFNPSIHFQPIGTATEDMLSITGVAASGNRVFQDADDGTVVAVGDNRDNASPHSTLIGWGTDANNPQLATYSGVMQIWNNGSSPVWTPGSSNAAAAQKVVNNQPYLYGWQWLNAAGGVDRGVDTRLNGNGVHYPDMEGANIQNFVNNDQHIGWNNCCSEDWTGRISEIAVYDQKLSGPDLQRVDSYFAIKYGITISPTVDSDPTVEDGDYVDSGSAVIWDYSANTTYQNNIAGIGRDDASALNQKQAKSANSGFQPVVGLTSIAATNAANANTFAADKNFMLWGSNTGSASFGITYAPTSFTPPAGYFRMARVWKVQETGTVGNVAVQATNADHLLVSSDPTFASGVTEIDMSSGSATVNFTNGQYFTFGALLTAPGGVVSGLQAWYDAASGVTLSGSNVSGWNDRTANGHNTTQATASRQPLFEDGTLGINFNPAIHFLPPGTATEDMLSITGVAASSNRVFQDTDDGSVVAVGDNRDNASPHSTLIGWGTDANNPQLATYSGVMQIWNNGSSPVWTPGSSNAAAAQKVVDNQAYLYGWQWLNAAGGVDRGVDTRLNGNGVHYPDMEGANIQNFVNNDQHIGWNNCCSEDWTGRISEIAVYDQKLNGPDLQRVDSYFAIKYGITISPTVDSDPTVEDGDYVDSGSAVVWDYSVNTTYQNNIAGIGRDDASALNQKQAKSVNSGFQPIIGLTSIAATNAANANTFAADKNFMVWGSNNSAASYGTAYTPTSFTPAAGYFRMNRVWKVQETGTVGNVAVQGTDADHLLVSSDPTFASGVTEIALSGGSATVNFTNGQFFTFGLALTAPGGVANGLAHWVRADKAVYSVADTTLAGAGANVKQWQDQSTQALHVTPNAAANEPIFQTGGATTNFNPYLDFTNDYLINASRVVQTTDGLTMISVGTTRVLSGVRTMYSLGTNGNEPTVDLESNFISPYYSFSSPSNVDIFTGGQVPTDVPMIWGSRAANNVADDFKFSFQGEEVATTLEIVPNAAYGNKVHVGTGVDTVWDGLIMEGLTYNRKLTSAEAQKVNSYLALKYGITLRIVDNDATIVEGDYIATDGTTKVWDKAANSTYHNNVAGIGRDDAEALNQKQSKSVNTGTQVVIGLGSIAATNAANANTFAADKSYEVWGNNTGAATLTSNYNGGTNNRITRVWKVQETGTVGTVKVQIPTATAAGLQSILVHTVNTFATVDRSFALTIVGSNYEADVNFNNNDFFTFSTNPAVVAAASVDKKFSSDNGVTFSDNITVTPGTTLVERIYYNNTGSASGTAAAIQATLPAGFTLVAGSTKNCLNPTAGETVCNTDAGQGGAISEGAVWSGQTLNIAPTAGVYGIATNAASGRLEVGKKRYLNLNECVYNAIGIDVFATNGHFNNGQSEYFAQTNVANTAQASANCGAGSGTYLFGGGSVVSLDLLGQRYVNFNECGYNQVGADFLNSSGHFDSVSSGIFAGTNTANTAQASVGCASGNGVYGLASATNTAFDLFDKRYFNLQECQFYWAASTDESTANAYSSGGFLAGTNASATPDTSAICGPGDGSFVLIGSSVLALDTLDTARGTGYIEFRMVATTAGSYTQNASLSGSNFSTQNDSGNLTVNVAADTDGDGVLDSTDVDDDNDGVLDTAEGNCTLDTDSDGTPNCRDLDSDNDGIYDVVEVGGVDTNNDGKLDGELNSQGQIGYIIRMNSTGRFITYPSIASIPSDGQSLNVPISPFSDAGWFTYHGLFYRVGAQGGGRLVSYTSIANVLSDIQASNVPMGFDPVLGGDVGYFVQGDTIYRVNGPALRLVSYSSPANLAADIQATNVAIAVGTTASTVDYFDAGGKIYRITASPNQLIGYNNISDFQNNIGSSLVALVFGPVGDSGWTAFNNLVPPDTDGDSIPNYLDLDSDGDGIPDNIEAQTTVGYVAPNGAFNAQGVDTAYPSGLTPVNTDGTDNPDYLDTNSDNAEGTDTAEAGLTLAAVDADQDGLDNTPDTNDSAFGPVNAGITSPATAYPNTNGTGDVDYRDTAVASPPDLTTTIGQPSPAFVAGAPSNVPLTVNNIGTGPTTGTVTASMTLPANTSAPASFTSGVWSCTTSGQTVTCTQPGPIAAAGSNVIQVPVTPNVSTVGTQPGPFTGSASTPGESNSGNNAASPMTPTVPVAAAGLTLPVKVLLQGAYNAGSGLMNDNLRGLASFPLTSPYGDGAVIASSSVLTANNIVDWVRIELRGTGALSTTVVASKGALLQRDGDVVGVDGVSTLSFSGLAGSSYYVVVKHRNHLGIMTANPVALSASTPLLDFTNPATPVYIRTRTVAQKSQSGKMLLWGGDANGDGDVKGAGPGTDPGAVRLAVLSHPGNTSFVANYVAAGYAKADVTMNGQTIGAGPGNEVSNLILPNVLTHPGNPTAQNNYIICQQLPEDPCN